MKVNRIYRIVKDEGYAGIHKRIKNQIKTRGYSYVLNLDAIKQGNTKLYMIIINDEMLNEMYNEYSNEISEKKYNILKDRISKKGCECYVAKNDHDEICGYFHIAYVSTFDSCINMNIEVDSETIYLFDDYTFERHRRKGVHEFSVYNRLKIGKEKGYKRAIVDIIDGNIPSEKAYGKFGFKKLFRYDYYHIGPFKRTIRKVV